MLPILKWYFILLTNCHYFETLSLFFSCCPIHHYVQIPQILVQINLIVTLLHSLYFESPSHPSFYHSKMKTLPFLKLLRFSGNYPHSHGLVPPLCWIVRSDTLTLTLQNERILTARAEFSRVASDCLFHSHSKNDSFYKHAHVAWFQAWERKIG